MKPLTDNKTCHELTRAIFRLYLRKELQGAIQIWPEYFETAELVAYYDETVDYGMQLRRFYDRLSEEVQFLWDNEPNVSAEGILYSALLLHEEAIEYGLSNLFREGDVLRIRFDAVDAVAHNVDAAAVLEEIAAFLDQHPSTVRLTKNLWVDKSREAPAIFSMAMREVLDDEDRFQSLEELSWKLDGKDEDCLWLEHQSRFLKELLGDDA